MPSKGHETDEVSMSSVAFVQITLHLVSGGRHEFIQTDPDTTGTLLEHLRPERVFAQKQVLIAGQDAVTVIPTANIERIDLRSDPLPDWPHSGAMSAMEEISEEDFVRIRRQEHSAPRTTAAVPAGAAPPPREIGVVAELRSGTSVYISAHPRPPRQGNGPISPETLLTPDDARAFLQHLFDRPVVFGTLDDQQGIFLINPVNAVRFLLAPPPPVQSLSSVWQLESKAS